MGSCTTGELTRRWTGAWNRQGWEEGAGDSLGPPTAAASGGGRDKAMRLLPCSPAQFSITSSATMAPEQQRGDDKGNQRCNSQTDVCLLPRGHGSMLGAPESTDDPGSIIFLKDGKILKIETTSFILSQT